MCAITRYIWALPVLRVVSVPLPFSLKGKALHTGAALRELMKSREEQFEQRFASTFGQLSADDLPAGNPCCAFSPTPLAAPAVPPPLPPLGREWAYKHGASIELHQCNKLCCVTMIGLQGKHLNCLMV